MSAPTSKQFARSSPGRCSRIAGDVLPIAEILEELHDRAPLHPGAMHYLIHLYDSARFAPLGLEAAEK